MSTLIDGMMQYWKREGIVTVRESKRNKERETERGREIERERNEGFEDALDSSPCYCCLVSVAR